MLLRFRVSNYASIRDELELSMVTLGDHPELAVHRVDSANVQALPVAAIYGANAAGKSNILDAMVYMRSVVINSHQRWGVGSPIPRRFFKLDDEHAGMPTVLIANFVIDGLHYEYGFSLDNERIVKEWLYSFPKRRARLLFERNRNSAVKFGNSLGGQRQQIARLIRPNSLFLSAAAANNHRQLMKIYRWFGFGISPVKAASDLKGSFTIHEWLRHDRKRLRQLLQYADIGVEDLEVKVDEEDEDAVESVGPSNWAVSDSAKVRFVHRGTDGSAALAMDEESTGTLAWTLLIGPVVSTMRRHGLLIVDEIDARLHPVLAGQLVRIFQDPETNPHGAQLVFSTHNVTLLGSAAPARLSRDEVWLAEKDDSGATTLTPLTAYRVRDQLENIEKRYLSGRYGAIPFIDNRAIEGLWDK